MDYAHASAGAAADAPSIPTRTRYNSTSHHHHSHSRRYSKQGHSGVGSNRLSIPPAASPEIISNLISSLSDISKGTDDYFEGRQTSSATSPNELALPQSLSGSRVPSTGSFGVDYGAYSKPAAHNSSSKDPISLDEIAASAPVIRTSKPTSGYSPLVPPKSPKRSTSRDNSSGLRSFIRTGSSTSRPSTNGSGRNDDAHSIGNLSVERGSSLPDQELSHRKSNDSWNKKTGRSYKGLMYMSSKERLREKEERKRSAEVVGPNGMRSRSFGNLNGANNSSAPGTSNTKRSNSLNTNKPDPFLAETAISEEPSAAESANIGIAIGTDRVMDNGKTIPARDSSLRKSSQNRSSVRRPARDSSRGRSTAPADTNTTASEPKGKRGAGKKVPARLDLDSSAPGKSFLLGPGEAVPTPTHTPNTQRFLETIRDDYLAFDNHTPEAENAPDEDGAPFPNVSQNRRRSGQSQDRAARRRSGAASPAPGTDSKQKRSSSRLKRLSRPSSPVPENEPANDTYRDNDTVGVPLERLDSADSIDDAVESYLCSPRLTQKIRHPQTGRTICFSEVGDSEGSAVFCCVGMGLTRYITAFYDELALTLKLRLITPDRPGVGESDPYPDGSTTPLSWPGKHHDALFVAETSLTVMSDDVYAICSALKITKFSILAHSAGAIYALATALRMPQHIRGRIHLLAPWIPPSQMNVFGTTQANPPTNAIPTSQRILRALPTPMLKVANSSFMSATSTSITTSLPKNSRRSKRKSAGVRGGDKDNNAAASSRNAVPVQDKENFQSGDYGKGTNDAARDGGNTKHKSAGANPAHNRRTSSALDDRATVMADEERQATYDTRLTHAIWELATTGANPAVDLLICLERRHTIGFRYVDINRPVIIHHGSRDTRVPVDNVRWLGKTMRRCEVRVLEGEGHGLMASAGVMGSVLMEISKEWDDWMRATGADGRKERPRRGTLRG